MSEISELISLLDERGIEWSNAPTWVLRWRDSEHREAKAIGFSNGLLCNAYLTPEQAVEATLGSDLKAENEKLRELVRDMWRDGMCECDERGACAKCEYGYLDRMRELGV